MQRVPGWVGWLGLAVYVAVWDLAPSTETLSHAFSPEGSHGKKIYLTTWILVSLHLARLLPERYDPLRRLDILRWKRTNQGGHNT